MILQGSVPAQGGPTRALVLPKNGPIFGYWLCYLQITGPNTIFLGASKQEAGLNQVGATQDGLQYNSVNTNGEPVQFLWRGELWVSGSAPGAVFVLVIPGMEKENLPCDMTDSSDSLD